LLLPWYHLNSEKPLQLPHFVQRRLFAYAAFPVTGEKPLKPTGAACPLGSRLKGYLPHLPHEDFHQPSSLFASARRLLFLITACPFIL